MRIHASILRLPILLAVMAGDLGCGILETDGRQRVEGTIDNGASFDPLSVADTAIVGVPITATVTTLAGSCTRADGAEVQMAASLADITPFDLLPPPGTSCIATVIQLPRSVVLTFDTPGPAIVRVHGRGPNGAKTLEHSITVRP